MVTKSRFKQGDKILIPVEISAVDMSEDGINGELYVESYRKQASTQQDLLYKFEEIERELAELEEE